MRRAEKMKKAAASAAASSRRLRSDEGAAAHRHCIVFGVRHQRPERGKRTIKRRRKIGRVAIGLCRHAFTAAQVQDEW